MTDEPIKRDQAMSRDELTARVDELFPQLTYEEREWAETPAGEPFCLIGQWAFTGLDSSAIELISSIPNTGKVGVYRIDPDNTFELIGLTDDPAIGMQAALN